MTDNTPGWKFNQWEMKGVPVRIEIGPREMENKEATVVRRDTGEKQKVKEKDLLSHVGIAGQSITDYLVKKSDEWLGKNIHSAKSLKEAESLSKKGGFIKAQFCSIEKEGQGCAEKLKEKCRLNVLGIRAYMEEKPSGKCVVCGKKTGATVYLGRQY